MKKSLTALMCFLCIAFALVLCTQVRAEEDVKFTWDSYNSADDIDGFKLYMSSSPNVAAVPANLAATIPGKATITYTQLKVPAGMKYWRLTAYKGAEESATSNETSYKVRLKAPTGLSNTVTLTFDKANVTITVAKR